MRVFAVVVLCVCSTFYDLCVFAVRVLSNTRPSVGDHCSTFKHEYQVSPTVTLVSLSQSQTLHTGPQTGTRTASLYREPPY